MSDVTCQWIEASHVSLVVFHKPSRQAIDGYIDWQKDHLAPSLVDGYSLTLMDIRASGMPSVAYMSNRSRWLHTHYTIAPISFTAILHNNNLLMSLLNTTMALVRRDARQDVVQTFTDEAAAWAWLSQQRAQR